MNSKAPMPIFILRQKLKLLKLGILKWKIPTHTTNHELLKLHILSKLLPEKSIAVEIGSYIGASSLMIAKGLRKNSKLICVDTWQNDAMTEGNWDSYKVFLQNTKNVKDRIIPIRNHSADAGNNFSDMIDFIFIDGDHSYEGVKNDVDIWFPKLNSGGIIVMHDAGWAEGVIKVIKEDIEPNLSKFESLPNMYWGWKK